MVKRETGGMVVKKETSPGCVMAYGQKYARRTFSKKIGVLGWYGTDVGKMTAVQVRKKSPLVPRYISLLQTYHEI